MTPASIAREARRQAALLGAIDRPGTASPDLRLASAPDRAASALAAWRANALALADKALGATFPTVRCMLGGSDFARLAGEFRAVHPPTCGDLGEWGEALPDFVEAHHGLAPWPWLADTARLDLALHRNARAADAGFDADSFELLHTAPPGELRLLLAPGTALIESAWPLATIHEAHADADADADFAPLAQAIETRRGESVMIVREGWRPAVHRLDAAGVDWIRSLLAGHTLAGSLDRAGARFDFAGWLAEAVRRSWLEGVSRPVSDPTAGRPGRGPET